MERVKQVDHGHTDDETMDKANGKPKAKQNIQAASGRLANHQFSHAYHRIPHVAFYQRLANHQFSHANHPSPLWHSTRDWLITSSPMPNLSTG
eukprot:scaffold67444_cov24-Cyclotella_meneghiniana.AAC.4